MFPNIISYFLIYALTYCGILLGRATQEEHKELEEKIKSVSLILKFISYGVLIYFFYSTIMMTAIVGSFLLFVVSKYYTHVSPFHSLYLYSLLYFGFQNSGELFFLIIPILIAIVFDRSLYKHSIKEEIYSIILLFGLYISLPIIF